MTILSALLGLLLATPPTAQSGPDRSIADDFDPAERDRFLESKGDEVIHRVADIPPEVLAAMGRLVGHDQAQGRPLLADPGQPFQASDIVQERLPRRGLVFASRSPTHCVLHYAKGGIGFHYVVLIFALDANPRLVWGGSLLRELTDVEAVRQALKTDAFHTRSIELNW